MIILVTMVAAAIPVMAPTNDDRRLREASRGLNAFISGAQMKAIELQRPYGVAIKRLSEDTNTSTNLIHDDNAVSVELFYVEQPPPYVGFDETASVQVAIDNATGGAPGQVRVRFVRRGTTATGLPVGWDRDEIPPVTIRPGDVIEAQGTQFRLIETSIDPDTGYYTPTSGTPDGTLVAVPVNDTGQQINAKFDDDGIAIGPERPVTAPLGPAPPYWTPPARYKVLRQPMPTSAEPFQLPEGTAIDLRASGVGSGTSANVAYFYYPVSAFGDPHPLVNNGDGILIMFAPEGRVSRVSFGLQPGSGVPFDQPVVDNLFLLVGRRENAPPPAVASDATLDSTRLPGPGVADREQQLQDVKEQVNWLRGESRWIVIGSSTGRVVTVENAFVDPQAVMVKYKPPPFPERSEKLRNAQIHESRQFAREMTQTGGR